MIQINVGRSEDKFEIDISGHAGFDEEGKDIVCAAVSILAKTLIWNLEEIKAPRFVVEEHGHINVMSYGDDAIQVLDIILVGLKAMAYGCPSHVKYSEY